MLFLVNRLMGRTPAMGHTFPCVPSDSSYDEALVLVFLGVKHSYWGTHGASSQIMFSRQESEGKVSKV